MSRSIRPIPIAVVLALLGCFCLPAARAQTPSARFAFADTTLLRDTLDLHFDRLFPLADSLRVAPDSLRAYSIRYRLPLERMVFLSDSLGTPVDSVGTLFAREQFNPLARTSERLTTFHYESSYTPSRLSSTWGNSATADLVRGPVTFRNVTNVLVNRIRTGSIFNFRRSKSTVTEAGWKFSPYLSAGTRFNVQRTETDQLGSQRVTSNTDVQGSIRSRFKLGQDLNGELNGFGGPFDEPQNSLSTGAKSGFGTVMDGHVQYSGPSWITFDSRGTSNFRIGHATIPNRATFPTRDLKWDSQGNASLFPNAPASLRVSYNLTGDRTDRASTFTQIVPLGGSQFDTVVTDRLVREPGHTAGIEVATQLSASTARLTITGNLDRSTRLLASERKEGLVIDRTESRNTGIGFDGSVTVRGWSLDAQYSDNRPTDDTPREGAVSVPDTNGTANAVPVSYRERSRTRTRSLGGQIVRSLGRTLTLRARGSVSLGTNRYDVTDNAYLAQTGGVPVKPGDPSDDYRQSYRLEATYSPRSTISSTVGLEVARITQLLLNADRSIANKEDRVYRSDWVWTYRLLPGLTANQRNQVSATYTRNIYVQKNNRLALSYTALTTLNARITTHLSADLNHNLIYSPNGGYARAIDGLEYFSVSDVNRDYSLYGSLNYTPTAGLTLTFNPTYTANQRDDRSTGAAVPTSRRRQLGVSAGASINTAIGEHARVSGSINRSFDSRRDVAYSVGVPSALPRSAYDFWNGSLQFTWNL